MQKKPASKLHLQPKSSEIIIQLKILLILISAPQTARTTPALRLFA